MSWHYHDGKCYGFRDRSDSWGGSQAYCRSMGASLAKMESEEEMEFIRDIWGGHTFWLGARDRITEGVWEWYDGSPVSWTYWGGSNPDGGTSENCLAWSGGGNQYWNSQRCYYSRYSVCSINVSQSLFPLNRALICRTVTEGRTRRTAAPLPLPAVCGEETATLTLTVLETSSAGLTTVTSSSLGLQPPRTAAWPSVGARGVSTTAVRTRSRVTGRTGTVMGTGTVPAVSPAEITTVSTTGGQSPTRTTTAVSNKRSVTPTFYYDDTSTEQRVWKEEIRTCFVDYEDMKKMG